MLVLVLEVLGLFVVLVSPRLVGLALLHPVCHCAPVYSLFQVVLGPWCWCLCYSLQVRELAAWGWFFVHGVGARIHLCKFVSASFVWFKVYGVGAVGSCGTWFSVCVVCGDVLVP